MRANCWEGKRKVRVETVPDPEILNSRDAIIKITSTAICGSDLHIYNGFIPTMERGDILGHEFMGEVMELGRDDPAGPRCASCAPANAGASRSAKASMDRARAHADTVGVPGRM